MKSDFHWPSRVFNNINDKIEQEKKENTIIYVDNNEKLNKLKKLQDNLMKFEKKSGQFVGYSSKLVFSDGNPDSKLMFIGEAPGEQEDIQQKPFVGRSGMLLQKFLAELKLDRSKYYIANCIPWRPPNNRTPTQQETALLRPFLMQHIKIIEPKLIVAVGAIAAKNLGVTTGITKAQGKMFETDVGKVFCIFHPAYVLRLPAKKKELWFSLLKMNETYNQLLN